MTKVLMAIIAVFLTVAATSTAEAKHKKYPKPVVTDKIDANGNLASRTTTQFSAKRHHYRTARYSRGGACDGFHRCRCGTTAADLHGIPYNYRGMNLKLASAWYGFPRTSCHAGAVGVRPHHVYTINHCNGDGTASVTDDAGTYTRRIAGDTFVSVNGGGERTYAARSHKRSRHHTQVAYAPQQYYHNYAY